MAQLTWLGVGVVGGVALGGWTLPLAWLWASGALWTATVPMRGAVRAVVVGLFIGLFAVASQPRGPALTGLVHARGVVAGSAIGRTASVSLHSTARAGGGLRPASGRVWVRFPDRPPRPGTEVLLWGAARPADRRALPGAPDPVRDNRRGRIHTLLVADRAAALGAPRVAPRAREGLAHQGLLTALATGDRSGVDPATQGLLRRTGTAHVLAISGFHVGLVGAMTGGVALAGLRAAAAWRPQGVGVSPALALGALCAVAYAASAGAPTSAIRAAGLIALIAVARSLGRRPRLIDVLGVVAGLQAAADPVCVGTASFQLSYGAVLGLCLVTPRLSARVPKRAPRLLTWAGGSLSATLGATVGTLGPAAWWLQALPVASPVANLVALPVVALIIVPAALGMTWAPEPLASVAAWSGDRGAALLVALLTPLDGPVLRPAVGPIGALALGLLPIVWKRGWLVLAVLLVVFVPRPLPTSRLTVLDVGQGEAIAVDHPDGRTWLVDAGPSRREVLHWLRRTGRTHLDVLALTHNHPDHIEGAGPILRDLSVGELWVSDTRGIEPLLDLAVRRGVRVRVRPREGLDPDRPRTRSANDASIVLRVLDAALLTGDAEAASEARLARLPLTSDVLKLGHHGSRTSSTDPLLDAVDPLVAVVSAGRGNSYGHPHLEVLDRLNQRRVPVYATSEHGTLAVDVSEDWLALNAHHAGRWRPLTRLPRAQARAVRARSTAPPPRATTAAPPPGTPTAPAPALPPR